MKKMMFAGLLCLMAWSCKTFQKNQSNATDDGKIEVVFLQLNDVYEISPLSGKGGLARVAQLRQQLLQKNPNTYTLLAGDFLSPSVISSLKFEDKRIRGRQMVDVLNTLGLDWVVFGNHEFDYGYTDLQARLDESNFRWLGTNLRMTGADAGKPFYKNRNGKRENCPDNFVVTARDADGTSLKIGVFGVTIASNPQPYVQYEDVFSTAQKNYQLLRQKSEVVIATTHLNVEDDQKLAEQLPDIQLIMGGHEHDNQIYKIGKTTLTKADANAKTVYIHTLTFDKKTSTASVKSELKTIDEQLSDEPRTAQAVAKWEKIKQQALESLGFEADREVVKLYEPLDCREAFVRNRPSTVGQIITQSMLKSARTQPDVAIVNMGSVRVDDVLTGLLTELDVVRMLPFGGPIYEVEMRGSLLLKTLQASEKNIGKGGYLAYSGIEKMGDKWMVGRGFLNTERIYKVVLPAFLLSGNEMNMGFLKAESQPDGSTTNPDILKIKVPKPDDAADLRNDIRLAVIHFLREK